MEFAQPHLRPAGRKQRGRVVTVICLGLVLVVLLGLCSRLAARGTAYPEASPRANASYAELAATIEGIIAAPVGATGVATASGPQLAAYLTNYALPLAGMSGYSVDVLLASGEATLVLRDGTSRPMALTTVAAPGPQGPLTLTRLWLGPVALPDSCTRLASDVVSATTGTGELGIAVLDARITGERAYVTVTRR